MCIEVLNGMADTIAQLEEKLAEREWIPCSDKLPSNNDCVLVTVDDSIEFGKYQDGEWSIWVCEHWDKWDAKGTIAWMPLPKPYREEREDYELATEQMEHDALYEPTYNSEDGSM